MYYRKNYFELVKLVTRSVFITTKIQKQKAINKN